MSASPPIGSGTPDLPIELDDAWLGKTIFLVSLEEFEAFRAILDAPPKPNARLAHTLLTPAPWD